MTKTKQTIILAIVASCAFLIGISGSHLIKSTIHSEVDDQIEAYRMKVEALEEVEAMETVKLERLKIANL